MECLIKCHLYSEDCKYYCPYAQKIAAQLKEDMVKYYQYETPSYSSIERR